MKGVFFHAKTNCATEYPPYRSGEQALKTAQLKVRTDSFQPKETPPIDYHKLMNGLYELNAKLPQSALERGALQRFILQLQAAVTLPEPVKSEEGIK